MGKEEAQLIEREASGATGPASPLESKLDRWLRAHSDRIVAALAALAAIRILILCAAFPLTNTIDERFHLVTIQMYAQGNLPGRELPHADSKATSNLLLYWSPEYGLTAEEMARGGISGPLWGAPSEERESALARNYYRAKLEQWLRRPNFEAQSAPLYYVVAGVWYRLGAALGMRDWRLDYWPRFLNPIAYGLLVWLSYRFVCRAYPERMFLHLAVPALIAVFPQDVFYGMNRDVFSGPLTAAALVAMMLAVNVDIDTDTKPGRDRYLILSSFLCGLAFVSSVSNCVLYGPLAITLWLWLRRSSLHRSSLRRSSEQLSRKAWVLGASLLAAGILPSLWMLRNYVVMGDLTGGKAKTRELGWTVKPLAEMMHNPLFSLHGLHYFAMELTRRFWRGEYVWHGLEMKSALADRFYLLSSEILLLVCLIEFLRQRKSMSSIEKLAGFDAAFLVASSVLFIVAISVPFDYHDCAYPSRAIPFTTSGRIVSGAILPFVLLYAIGLERVTSLFRKWIPPVAMLACIMLFVTVSEIRVRSIVFSSPYDFFALSGWRR
jgi:hypothetical protein